MQALMLLHLICWQDIYTNKFMRILIIICMLLHAGLTSCREKTETVLPVFRDRSINISNAFSDLFLDSLQLEVFIKETNLDEAGASNMREFYNNRNFQFAWFTEDGLAEQAAAFWNLHISFTRYSGDSSLVDKQLHQQMQLLMDESDAKLSAEVLTKTELQLTRHFFEYAAHAFEGKVDPKELQWHIPRKKVDALKLLDTLIATKGRNLDAWVPLNVNYHRLKEQLLVYYDLQKNHAALIIHTGDKKVLRKGDSAAAILQVKQILFSFGDLKTNDQHPFFDAELEIAVKHAQNRFGLLADGVIGPATLKELNVPMKNRIEQILINLERMRWMPKEPEGDRLIVNIPDYKLHVFEKGEKVFDMNVVVGTAANRTVVFNDELKYVVFSPYWNIPNSIIRKEIMPAMQKNPGYLSQNNMEQTGTSNGIPQIRQKPGPGNALGKVKFIFPNSYAIYFHDTPAKSLFSREQRAYSHGCIRLEAPTKLAAYLLRNDPSFTDAKIDALMNAGSEKWVTLKEPVPVIISYFTAWVDSKGVLHFRDDIYGHDKRMAERLFTN